MSKDTKRLIIAKLLWLRESAAKLGAKFNYRGGNFLQSKMFLGGVSLCISLLLWSLVALDNNAESARTMRDEIEYRNLGAGYSVNAPVKEVEIKLEGKINELSGIEPSDIVSEVDLANLRTGRYTLPVRFEAPTFARVRSWQPALVEVEIYRNVERRVEITAETTGEAPDGKVVSSIVVSPDHAVVSGPETDVLSVQGLEVRVNLDHLMESGKVKAPVMIKDSSSSEEPAPRHRRVSVSPQEAEVVVTFEDEIVGERIPVKVSVTGEPHAGLQVESVKVIPDSVSIRGSAAAVRSIDSLVLAPVDITGLEQDIQLMIPMEPTQLPPGVEITGTDRARVEIHLSKKMSVKTFQNVPLMIAGNTASKEWRFSPPSVSLTIEGPETAVEALEGQHPPCELYVDVSNIVSQHTELPVLVRGLRPGFQVVRTEPEQVSVTSVE